MNNSRSKQGWSLVELLFVIAIVAILGGIAAGGLGAMRPPAALDTMRQTLISVFRQAGMEAAVRNQPARILIHGDSADAENYLGLVRLQARNADGSWSAVGPVLRLGRDVKFEAASLSGSNAPPRIPAAILPSRGEVSCYAFEVSERGFWEQAGSPVYLRKENSRESSGFLVMPRGQPLPLEPED